MNTPRVSREQAELLKKVGYDVPTSKQEYIPYGQLPFAGYETLFIPTLDEATRWLRDVKGRHVYSEFDFDNGNWNYVIQDLNDIDIEISDNPFDTTDFAQSAGINLILKKLEDGTDAKG
jgi:hypothetical protein